MTYITNHQRMGYIPMQHHQQTDYRGRTIPPHYRHQLWGARVNRDGVFPVVVPGTAGPLMGGMLWRSVDHATDPRFWSYATPGVVGAVGQTHPAGPGWAALPRYRADPAYPLNNVYPENWPVVVTNALGWDAQDPVAVPGFAGLVLRDNDPATTPVYGLTPAGGGRSTIDTAQKAMLDTLLGLYALPGTGTITRGAGAAAFGVGLGTRAAVTHDPDTGFLQYPQHPQAPLLAKCTSGRHARNGYGPAHISTRANYTPPDVGQVPIPDGPLDFGGYLQPESAGAVLNPVYLRFDRTRLVWAWQAEGAVGAVTPPPDPPPLEPPPRGDPPPDPPPPDGVPPGGGQDDPPPGGGGGPEDDDPPRGFGPSGLIRPLDPFFEPGGVVFNAGLAQTGLKLHGTPRELATPGTVHKAVYVADGALAVDTAQGPLNRDQQAAWYAQPVTARTAAFGQQHAHGHVMADTDPRYCGQNHAVGGTVYMPGNYGLAYLLTGYTPPTVEPTHVYWRSKFALGTPDLTTGGITGGSVWGLDATGQTTWDTVADDGTTARVVTAHAGKIGFMGATPCTPKTYETVGTTSRAFDASAVTVAQLAAVVHTLLGDLRCLGLVV